MRLAVALSCLLLVVAVSEGFVIPSSVHHQEFTTTSCLAAKKQQQPQPKKPRFAQIAHNNAAAAAPKRQQQQQQRPKVVPRKEEDIKERQPQSSSSSISRNDEYMWRTSKSIQDIEDSMTKRWGTESGKWEADPNEYEMMMDHEEVSTASSNDDERISSFRGKPVLDPWQKEDMKTSSSNTPSLFGASDKEDVTLQRVRRNQERANKSSRSRKAPAWADMMVDDEEEFYDEDDEGFEAKSDDDVGKLISPRPVGGVGTNNVQAFSRRDEPTNTNTASSDSNSPGFFFNPNGAKENNSDAQQTRDQPSADKPKKPKRSVPLLDEDGNKIFLTTEQADRNFKSSMGGDTDGEEEEDSTTPWDELGITSKPLLKNLYSMGCESPLSVQEKSCPSVLTGNDVLVGTYTGSGKTLAFLVPLVQRLLLLDNAGDKGIQVLIVAPGRELASQITSVARELLEGMDDMKVVMAIGGTTFSRNLEQIRKKKPTILVGTPGRIAELIVGQPGEKKGRMNIALLQTVVLDEFDALLEYKPHRDPTAAIMGALKRRHRDSLQSILCSATASDMIGSIKLSNYLRPGHAIAMADKDDKLVFGGNDDSITTRVSRTVVHGVIHVPRRQLALNTIRRILHTEPVPQQVLIFADNARRVDLVVEKLAEMDIIAAALHGGAKSDKMDRAEVSKALREGYVGIVVATELAARGLDAPLLTHVINLDLPTDASHYAHRAGRCGRGGRPGVVINITTGPQERNVPNKFSNKLGVDMHVVEPRQSKLLVLDPETVELDVKP